MRLGHDSDELSAGRLFIDGRLNEPMTGGPLYCRISPSMPPGLHTSLGPGLGGRLRVLLGAHDLDAYEGMAALNP